jgi:hypothetical protein
VYGHFRASPFSKWPKSDSPLRDALADISQQHLAKLEALRWMRFAGMEEG